MPSDQDMLNFVEATDRGRMYGGDGPGFDPGTRRARQLLDEEDDDSWMPTPDDGDGEDD